MTHGGGWTFSQSFSSLALTVWDLWCLQDWEEKDDQLTHLINYEAVYRTAPAKPSLLNILLKNAIKFREWFDVFLKFYYLKKKVSAIGNIEPANAYFLDNLLVQGIVKYSKKIMKIENLTRHNFVKNVSIFFKQLWQ